MFLVVGLEDYLEREVKNSVAAAVKVLFWVLLLLWPLAAILGAFGNGNSHTWWQWTLAGLGEALWLIIMLAVWASVEGSKNASNTTRSSRRRRAVAANPTSPRTAVRVMTACGACGHPVKPKSNFCENCGSALSH